jgi:ABC-2 type transport system permease protein
VGREHVKMASYFAPSMAMVFLFFTVGFGAKSLYVERREGLVSRLQAGPVSSTTIVGAKALAMCGLGLLSMSTIWATSVLVFGATWGAPGPVLLILIAMVLAAIGITSLVASAARTEEQIDLYSGLTGFVLALLGGSFIQYFQMPRQMQLLSLVTPNGWALRSFADMVAVGGGIFAVLPAIAAIGAFAVISAFVAARRLNRVALP